MKHFLPILASAAIAAAFFVGCKKEDPIVVPDEETEEEQVTVKTVPSLWIQTPNSAQVTSKSTWMSGAYIYLTEGGGSRKKIGTASIKGRGNTTWGFPKKPYALKFDEKVELLGLPKGNRFDLIANYIDITDMRNAIALEIGRRTKGLEWTPHCEFVEMYFNDKKQGNYLFTEHIKIAKNRLNLKEGGYLIELDVNYDEEYKFHSTLLNMPVMIKDYEGGDINDAVLERVKKEFNELEAMVVSEDRTTNGWQNCIDMDSFIDWWFVYELAQCGEPNAPKSTYMYRDNGGKMKCGPVWDFDWGTFRNGQWVNNFRVNNPHWLKYMFKDPAFVKRVKEKWAESKNDLLNVTEYIDETASYIRTSAIADKVQWPMTTHENDDEDLSFDAAISRLKSGYKSHWQYMDERITNM